MKEIGQKSYRLFYTHKIVLILVSFIIGILLNEHTESPWILAAITASIAILLTIIARNYSFLLFLPLGLIFAVNSQQIYPDNVLNYAGKKIDIEGTLYRSPERTQDGSRIYLQSYYVINNGTKQKVSGNVMIYALENIELSYGERVRLINVKLSPFENYNNPGGFDLKKFYERQYIFASGFIQNKDQIISFGLSDSFSKTMNYIDKLRIRYGNFVREKFKSPQSEILNAISIGEKRGLPQQIRTEFSRAGVAHIFAISGLHVGAVALAFFFLIKWLLKRSEYLMLKFQVPRLAAAITIVPVFLYSAVAGFSTSTLRAFIMISLYLISIVIGKEEHRINTLCAAAFIILVWHPWSLFELSFQLSFSAVFAILIAHKFYPFKFVTIEDKIYSLLKTTIAAALITFPLVANSFGIMSLVSIPANLTLVPIVEFIVVPISLLSFVAFLISPYIAEPLMSLNLFFIDMLIFGVELFLKIPYSSLTVPPMNTVSWIVFVILAVSLVANSLYPKIKYILPILVLGFIASIIYPISTKSINDELVVSFIDAGESRSSVLIEQAEGRNILINGGYTRSNRDGYLDKTVVTKYLLNRGIRQIDLFILNSLDKDHLNGAVHITDKFDVSTIVTNGDKLIGELWEKIYEKNIEWASLSDIGDQISIDNLKIDILRPAQNYISEDSSMPYPIAFRVNYGDTSLLMGESLNKESVQRDLMKYHGDKIDATVLYLVKISDNETSYEFINSVSPEFLIVGNNEKGNVVLTSDGIDVEFED
ncbi:MAG: DNA internalization-related competence protein ComEC/Rec2 [Thermodesulfobacteriota bacterium]